MKNSFYNVEILSTGNYKVGNLVINPNKTEYAENSLKHIQKRLEIQENYIASIEQKLAEARNTKSLLLYIKSEVQNNVVQEAIKEVEIVLVSSIKKGTIKERHLVTPEEAQQLIELSNKWMLTSTWESLYHSDTMVEV